MFFSGFVSLYLHNQLHDMLDAAEKEIRDFGGVGITPPKAFDTFYTMVKYFKCIPSEVNNGSLFVGGDL